jgi:hypothetical protein
MSQLLAPQVLMRAAFSVLCKRVQWNRVTSTVCPIIAFLSPCFALLAPSFLNPRLTSQIYYLHPNLSFALSETTQKQNDLEVLRAWNLVVGSIPGRYKLDAEHGVDICQVEQ